MKVLFIDSVHPILKDQLQAVGFQCDEFPEKSHKELKAILGTYDGVVIRSKFKFTPEVFDIATNLKFIARSGAGMENIDLSYAKQKNVICFNSPEGNRDAVGEHALGMLLCLFNHLHMANLEVRQGLWQREKNRGLEIKGKTVAIIGCGNMGMAFAQRLQGFECNVIGYDKYKSGFGNNWIKEVSLEEVFETADIVSLHTPLQDDTFHLVNAKWIESFQKPFYLINTARGKNVSTKALTEGIESGKILGACLDVLEFESTSFENVDWKIVPQEMQYLIESDKVLLSPHVAGWTVESYIKLSSFLAEKIINQFHES